MFTWNSISGFWYFWIVQISKFLLHVVLLHFWRKVKKVENKHDFWSVFVALFPRKPSLWAPKTRTFDVSFACRSDGRCLFWNIGRCFQSTYTMPSKTQTHVDIPLNAAISIAAGRSQRFGTRHTAVIFYTSARGYGTGTVNVKYTSHTYTGTNAWGFPQSRNVRFFAPGNFLTHFYHPTILPSFPFQSTQIFPSNVLFKL